MKSNQGFKYSPSFIYDCHGDSQDKMGKKNSLMLDIKN